MSDVNFGPKYNDPDLVEIFAAAGRGVGRLFTRRSSKKTAAVPEPAISHTSSFGAVYANELALKQLDQVEPEFAAGSIFIREKNLTPTSPAPEALSVMVKGAKGSSPATGDWEFIALAGDLSVRQRETVGICSACHTQVKQTDWVYRTYIK